MNASLILVLAVSVLIIVGILYSKNEEMNNLVDEGKAIKRDVEFYKEAEFFTASIPVNAALDKVSKVGVSGVDASAGRLRSGNPGVAFRFDNKWTATFAYLGKKEGREYYQFSFTSWKTRKGGVYGYKQMNMLQTAVEKALLSLDAQTAVETQRMKVNTKPSFF